MIKDWITFKTTKWDKDMPNYRRAFVPGGTWFFTVNLLERHGNDLLVREIDLLRETVHRVRHKHPFHINAWVVLPDHMHCVMTLPPGDSDFSRRWRLIKSGFSRALPKTEPRSEVRQAAGERGHVQRVRDWPYSTFHRYVAAGVYPEGWCGDVEAEVEGDV